MLKAKADKGIAPLWSAEVQDARQNRSVRGCERMSSVQCRILSSAIILRITRGLVLTETPELCVGLTTNAPSAVAGLAGSCEGAGVHL